IRSRCPALEHVVLIEGESTGAISLAQLRREGDVVDPEEVERRVRGVSPEDLATLVYTSGTTGPPKGCMLTHANFLSATAMYRGQLELDDIQPVIYMFLPLAHVLARLAQTVVIDVGGTLVYWRGDAARILDEVAESQPTHYVAGPGAVRRARGQERGPTDRGPAASGGPRRSRKGPLPLRGAPEAGARRRSADRSRAAGVLRRLRGARARGVWHDRELRHRHAQSRERTAVRHGRAGAARQRGDGRRGRRSPAARPARVRRLSPRPRGDRGRAPRWLAVHRRYRLALAGRIPHP